MGVGGFIFALHCGQFWGNLLLWHNVKIRGSFSIWQNFEQNSAKILCYWSNCCIRYHSFFANRSNRVSAQASVDDDRVGS